MPEIKPWESNPYEAPQAILKDATESYWPLFMKRTTSGFFVGAILYTAVHFAGGRNNSGSAFINGLFLAGLFPLVAGTSVSPNQEYLAAAAIRASSQHAFYVSSPWYWAGFCGIRFM